MDFIEYSDNDLDDLTSFKDVMEKYLVQLKWFVLSVLGIGILTFIYLRNVVPEYGVSATILIKDAEAGSSSFADLSAFEDFGLFGGGSKGLENEIQILTSRRLMTSVVKELKLDIQYFIEDSPFDREQYPNFPITINFRSDSISRCNIATNFEIRVRSRKSFEFVDFDEVSSGIKMFGKDFIANLGNDKGFNKQKLSVDLNDNFSNDLIGKSIFVSISPVNAVVDYYMNKIVIEPVNEKLSKVLSISVNEKVKEKGIVIINNLIEQYNADGINDNNEIAQTTTDFLDSRIGLISTELAVIEGMAEQFKTKNRMLDSKLGASYYLQSSSLNERDLVEANMQLQLVVLMLDELIKKSGYELLPGNIGLSDIGVIKTIGEYNELILQRNRILKSSSVKNPIIIEIDSQLIVLRENLINGLKSIKSSSKLKINALNSQSGIINSRIASVPKNEREFKDIVRQQETKNALYLFLLQKREESILSNAVNIEKSKIIDAAYSNGIPVYPKKPLTYFASILLGLLIPFIVIYIKDILDTKVHDEKDLKKLNIPYLGDIPFAKSNENHLIDDGDNSNVAEAFRYIRTNISFMLDSKDACKTVFITSTLEREGKSLTAINLALSLAISGKRTLLLGLDLRAPKITRYLDTEDILGVTNFVKNNILTIDEISDKYMQMEKLHLINSGSIPPNPVELLMSDRIHELFEEAKKRYDYIIVDTAPVGMVTDTIQIGKFADLTIYVVKANLLDKRMLHIPEKLHKENKLHNMAILINGTDHSKGAYGYGYGYGNKLDRPWYKKIIKNAAF